ncbi:ABC-three component system middle component 8 [uncultured Clostridium sp.]|mgnify:CR=1 FL=1|uniref:ABC-three component system middle component 8 n=1 Tax=uncultured Clostridium sp. TaxID=59620 RepID=UPI0025DAC15B|nr:ABC-three component system middle component 8 [uncultured Clostridium sp.]
MIKPTKFLDLDNCVISIASKILQILSSQKSITYTNLLVLFKNDLNDNFEYNLLPAIDFLFLLGLIDYSPNSDSLELIQ